MTYPRILIVIGLILGPGPKALFARSNAFFDTLPCRDELKQQLKEWNSQGKWREKFSMPATYRTFLTPTAELGAWINLTVTDRHNPILSLETETKIVFKEWISSKCTGISYGRSKPSNRKKTGGPYKLLTDAELKKLIVKHDKGILFLWSPSMKISIWGLQRAISAAKKLRIKVFAVVSRLSDEKRAHDVIKSLPIRQKDVWIDSSFELLMRGMDLHLPSLLVFENGDFTNPVRRGYEEEKVYENYFRHVFTKQHIGLQ